MIAAQSRSLRERILPRCCENSDSIEVFLPTDQRLCWFRVPFDDPPIAGKAQQIFPELKTTLYAAPQDNAVLTEVLRVEPQLPRGPNDILEDYEAEMAKITSRVSHELGEICEAMARVSSQANRASTWLGNIRSRRCSCQLLSALHAILEQPVGTSLHRPDKG
jgi:hypothetical protein